MQVRIKSSYKVKKEVFSFSSDWLTPDKALILFEDLKGNQRFSNLQMESEDGSELLIKHLKKLLTESKQTPSKFTLFFDGGYDEKMKRSGLGCVLTYHLGENIYRIRKNLATHIPATNSEAEYFSLFHGLELLRQLDFFPQDIIIKGDSLGVINQLKGEWPVLDPKLNEYADQIEGLLKTFQLKAHFQHVPRDQNKEADQLATLALEGTEIFSEKKIMD